MRWSVEITVPPAQEPIGLAQAKLHLKIDGDAEDALIEEAIAGARSAIEAWCDRALIEQTRVLHLDSFPEVIELPGGQCIAVDEVRYFDAEGAVQTIDVATLLVHTAGNPPTIETATTWPETQRRRGAVAVTYRCGWPSAIALPPAIVSAVKLLVGELYKHREDSVVGRTVTEIPTGVQRLLKPWRKLSIA